MPAFNRLTYNTARCKYNEPNFIKIELMVWTLLLAEGQTDVRRSMREVDVRSRIVHSSVGTATGYGLDGWCSFPGREKDFYNVYRVQTSP
jgi:hypothetical protein